MTDRREHEGPPPAALKGRVIESLRAAGLLRPSAGRRRQVLAWVATIVVAFAGGYLTKARTGSAQGPTGVNRYALLLYTDSAFSPGTSSAERVAEYAEWARSLRARNRLELGEKLGDSARLVTRRPAVTRENNGDSSSGLLAGLFIVRASGLSDAAALAATCPHVHHGGSVVVRPIDPT